MKKATNAIEIAKWITENPGSAEIICWLISISGGTVMVGSGFGALLLRHHRLKE